MRNSREPARRAAVWLGIAVMLGGVIYPLAAQQGADAGTCRISGRATNGGVPLPGVSLVAHAEDTVKGATSTDADGAYRLSLSEGTYRLTAELTGFDRVEHGVAVGPDSCNQTLDIQLPLAPRVPRSRSTSAPPGSASSTTAPPPAAAPGRGAQPAAAGAQRFETLAVQAQAGAVAGIESIAAETAADSAARLLLPPGFSTEGPTEAVAINGDMARLDGGMMAERFGAIGRGEFDPVTGEFGQGFGPAGRGGPGEFGGPGRGGRGGPGAGRGGRGGPGAFAIGGRGGRQNLYSANVNYSFGGSALDSSPYQLRSESPAEKRPYTRQTFGATFGGPVKIPGVYDGTRRTNLTLTYGGNRGSNLFNQYATVPTDAMRAGNFSSSGVRLVDPITGDAFPENRIPQDRIDPGSLLLLGYIPQANLSGASRNFHRTTTTESASDNVNVRITHSFTPAAGRGGRGGGRGGPGGRMGGPGGRGQQGTTANMNAQLQYRRNDNEQANVLPTLGGRNRGSTFTLPVTLNINHRRTLHNVNVNASRTTSTSINNYAFVDDVAGRAGIIGVATDPFAWGVPSLSFASLSSVRDMTPTRRSDTRLSLAYGWSRPFARHTLRAGGGYRFDRSSSQTDANARGAFVFTGLYSAGGANAPRGSGADFADFLLGLPQQASVQYGPGNVRMTGRSLSLYLQDDWRRRSNVTFNLGLRYELLWPFLERQGRMVNLDAPPDFTAVAPVVSGGTGPFTGGFPDALMRADINNLAPRVGVAWRAARGTTVRGGYGVSFNAGSYSTIARQLVGQPPFAVTNTSIGTASDPLTLTDPFASASPTETTNNYGVQKDYALGRVQTWNADVAKDLSPAWNAGASYTHTRGSSLDIVRAPNRDPDGLRIEGVQPFLWQSAEGASVLHAGTLRLQRRTVRGVGGGLTYTLARSRDNASSIGGGGTVVAQDDRNLDAEWGLSSFDRRHQVSTQINVELPFGRNRRWLNDGGLWSMAVENWRMAATFTWQSGTPYTARVQGAASDVARGTNGTLRADYNGQPVQLVNPTIDRFFNTAAFATPAPGEFGTASRNMIVGPGSRQLNANLSRDVRLGANRVASVQLTANNLLNMVNYAGIDTNLNSRTFGQVTSVRPMRSMQLNVRLRF
jgi:hypothetical protein